ncbi:MFS transporter [Nesterenkonia sp. LB17]|uniref:MFS transporter n=1 Tax=Nesterenkonia sp. LB17 TaxID=2901230 RepID=UPI001F4CA93B|nr:MFS transporter [Nesterenkonia sp. LB17]MCH8565269.1 MFS transporter [Nesterenkonia sp. LB17]
MDYRVSKDADTLPIKSSRLYAPVVPWVGLFVLGWGSNQFSPLILFYPQITPIGPVEIQGLFVLYGVTLIPSLLLGGWLSDRFGRPVVLTVAVAFSALSSAILMSDGVAPTAIIVARVMTGISCGAGFSAGTAWVTESLPPPRGSRSSVVAMTAGMGVGSLFVGLLASGTLRLSLFSPQLWVMLPHVLLSITFFALSFRRWLTLRRCSSQDSGSGKRTGPAMTPRLAGHPLGLRDPRFRRIVLPLAPWTLVCTAVPLAILPSALSRDMTHDALLFSAFLTPLPALGALLVQPIAGRAKISTGLLAPLAMAIATAAFALSIIAVHWQLLTLLPVACLVFGLAHGFCQTAGLRIIASLSPSNQLGRNTAVFQALSYIGFLSPLPIAMLAQFLALSQVLLGMLILASLTFVALLPWRQRIDSYEPR